MKGMDAEVGQFNSLSPKRFIFQRTLCYVMLLFLQSCELVSKLPSTMQRILGQEHPSSVFFVGRGLERTD